MSFPLLAIDAKIRVKISKFKLAKVVNLRLKS